MVHLKWSKLRYMMVADPRHPGQAYIALDFYVDFSKTQKSKTDGKFLLVCKGPLVDQCVLARHHYLPKSSDPAYDAYSAVGAWFWHCKRLRGKEPSLEDLVFPCISLENGGGHGVSS